MEFASPRWGAYEDTRSLRDATTPSSTYAVSAQYAAYADRRGVFARKLATGEHYKRLFRYEDERPWFQPVLAFSTIRGRLLAIATGVQILVFDVDTKSVKYALKGNGRIITSLAWSESKAGILATGAVDGSICVWSIKHPARPLYHVRAFHGACNRVAFHPKDQELLAGCHNDCISVWALPSTKPFLVTKAKDSDFTTLRWFATDPLRVLGISSTGSVCIYDVHSALETFRQTPSRRLEDNDDEETMFGRLEDIGYMPASEFSIGMNISQALLIGRNGLIVLPRDGHILFFITFFADRDEATELWRLRLDDLIDCFSLRVRDRAVQVVACMGAETQAYEVPGTVLDGMGWKIATSTSGQYGDDASQDRTEPVAHTMRPELHVYSRLIQSPPTSRKPPVADRLAKPDVEFKKKPRLLLASKSKAAVPADIPSSITSSLELSKSKGGYDEQESPITALSPSIPARHTSLERAISPLDESMHLPARASFDSITSTAGHDSDSDDETFAEQLQGSGSFLPGGVNVPLPRTCGASFGANGQLIMFFPTRAQPASMNNSITVEAPATRERHNSTVTRLFPHFGNLGSRVGALWSTTDSVGSPEKYRHVAYRSSMPISSFGNNPQWSTRTSPTKPTNTGLTYQKNVKVAIHEVKSLQAMQRLAYEYRVLPEKDESMADLCSENATSAANASMKEAARMWRMLAVLLEQRTCDTSKLTPEQADGVASSRTQRPALSRNISAASAHDDRAGRHNTVRLEWLHHPMGRNWAMEKILSWAELQADVQMLACVTSILIRLSEDLRLDNSRQPLQDCYGDGPQSPLGRKPPPSIPLVRTDTNITDVSLSDYSPVKPYSSRTSSRDPSLPTTPYIDSSTNTPPLALPPLNRHTSRLSASGSASPETHRGSFSAAAKYYAQTISDKLGGYSTSPPIRKLGGSPANELSTSLPTAIGSWSKSVTFAAGSDPTRDGRRSLSLAHDDDSYDSDRTIDEMSLPRTPNSNHGITVRTLNGQSFGDYGIVTRPLGLSLLPQHLATKSSIWRDTYAEQLRSWDLIIEAAEYENISDLAGAKCSIAFKGMSRSHVVPHIDPQRRGVTCCICFCIIKAAKQVCPACLHTTHKHCLEELVADFDGVDAAFTCPTGCGCECAAVGDVSYHAVEEDRHAELEAAESAPAIHAQYPKNRSLTDPRLLRQRSEGNSW